MRRARWNAMNGMAVLAGVLAFAPLGARAVSCALPPHTGGEWPMLNGPVTGTRHQAAETEIGPLEAARLAPKWKFSIFGAGGASGIFQSTATVSAGCVYAGTSQGWVFAINAETGELVWKAHGPETPSAPGTGNEVPIAGTGVFAVAADGAGRVIAGFSMSERHVRAFDQFTGAVLWTAGPLGSAPGEGRTITASPVVWNGMVFVPLATEIGESRVAYYLLSAATGAVLHKGYVIPEKDLAYGYGGGGIWSTPAVDVEEGYLYAGTSDSETYTKQHRHNNALVKIDVKPGRPTFGQVVDAYKGVVDTYIAGTDRTPVCQQTGDEVGQQFRGGEYSPACGELDIDFGASINLFVDEEQDKVITVMQKACVFHAVTADTMTQKWVAVHSHPDEVGCYATSAVGDGKIFAPSDQPAVVWAMSSIGYPLWVTPNDVIASGPPISYANGVVYTADSTGLVAWNAQTGLPLLNRPFSVDVGEFCGVTAGGVSIARNTVFVECDWSPTSGGWLVAYEPAAAGLDDGDALPDPVDNCPIAANPLQEDTGGVNSSSPDGIGNACQCGDVTGNGIVNGEDALAIQHHGLGALPNPTFAVPGNCDVTGNGSCNGQDAKAVQGTVLGEPSPMFGQNCQNADPNAPPCTNCTAG